MYYDDPESFLRDFNQLKEFEGERGQESALEEDDWRLVTHGTSPDPVYQRLSTLFSILRCISHHGDT